jgi:hypothetical protein
MTAQQSLRRSRRTVPKETPIVIGTREQLFHLLAEASEIERTLVCNLCGFSFVPSIVFFGA